ncbi:hypothetical protein KKH65_06075, partial [bacterium]|nr:hypothetical protein [bacterium]
MKRLVFLLSFFSILAFAETLLLGDLKKQLAAREDLFLFPKQVIVTYEVAKPIEKKPANPLFALKNDGESIFPSAVQREERVVILPPVPSLQLSSPPLNFSYPAFSEIKKEIEGKREREKTERGLKDEVAKTKEERQPEIPPLEKTVYLEEIAANEELDIFSPGKELIKEAEKLLAERELLEKEEMKDLEPDLENLESRIADRGSEKEKVAKIPGEENWGSGIGDRGSEREKDGEKEKVTKIPETTIEPHTDTLNGHVSRIEPPKVEIAKIEPPKEPEPISMEAMTVKAQERTREAERRIETLAQIPYNLQELKTTPGEWAKWKLPEESELNVSGRKFIKMEYNGKSWLNTKEKNKSSNQLNINQELEVKIQGIVKKKVTVNIDYSDKSADIAPPKKTFEVKYAGEKEEIIQEMNFGDVALEIPETRFVSYKKSGFGINGKAQFLKNTLGLTAIASREKGESRSKEWTGTQSLVLKDISGISFISRRYYQLLAGIDIGTTTQGGRIEYLKNKGYLPIKPGSVKVYIDDQIGDNNYMAEQFTAY